MKKIILPFIAFLLLGIVNIKAQGFQPCSAATLSVYSSYQPSSYSLVGVLINNKPDPTCDYDKVPQDNTKTLQPGYWIKFTVPQSGIISLKTENVSIDKSDIGLAIFSPSGSCPGNLVLSEVTCIPNGNGYMPYQENINLESYKGKTMYIRIWKYGSIYTFGNFKIGIWDAKPCAAPATPQISGNTISCGEPITLRVTNPENGVTYKWSNGQTGTEATYSSSATNVKVTATGCNNKSTTSSSVNVTIQTGMQLPIVSGIAVACDKTIIRVNNIKVGDKVIWSDGFEGATREVTETGIYSAKIVRGDCETMYSDPFSVTINTKPQNVEIEPLPEPVCPNATIELSVKDPNPEYIYTWSNGVKGTTVSGNSSNIFTVTAKNINCGSTTSAPYKAEIKAKPDVPIIVGENKICQNGGMTTLEVSNPCADCTHLWNNGETTPSIEVTMKGSYSVLVTDGTCTDLKTNSMPYSVSYFYTTKPLIAMKSNVFTLTNATSFVSFQWYNNGVPIPNETNSTYVATEQGEVSIAVIDANDCPIQSTPLKTLASDEVDVKNIDFSVFPNPTDGNFNIILNTKSSTAIKIRITNILGQVFYERSPVLVDGKALLNIPFQSPINGEYLVQIITNDKVVTQKLTVIN